jgi:hypothetical protein
VVGWVCEAKRRSPAADFEDVEAETGRV